MPRRTDQCPADVAGHRSVFEIYRVQTVAQGPCRAVGDTIASVFRVRPPDEALPGVCDGATR